MRIKPKVQEILDKCFKDLKDAGFDVGAPEITFDHDAVYGLGRRIPQAWITKWSMKIEVAIPESAIELQEEK
jgi:phospholipase C